MEGLSKRQLKYLRKRERRVRTVMRLSERRDGYSPAVTELHAYAFLAPAGLLAFAGDLHGYTVMTSMTDEYAQSVHGEPDEEVVAEQARHHLQGCSLYAEQRGFQVEADIMLSPVLSYMRALGLEFPEAG